MNNKVIYTSLTAGYDDLKQPASIQPDYDYICFSNDIPCSSVGVWQIRKIPFNSNNGTRLTRFPKLNPHIVLSDYEYSLWVDANLDLADAIIERANQLVAENVPLAMLPHSDRTCVYQEARCLTRRLIDNPNIIFKQTCFLLKSGLPENSGLFVCCCILRKHNHPEIKAFSETWWNLYLRYSYRDQMSVTYALWKNNLTPVLFWTKDFYSTFIHPHKAIIKHRALPKRCFRYIISHLLLFRLYLLYRHFGISWNKCY